MSIGTDEIVGAARAWLGTPYRHQASTLGAWCDCLGLLRGGVAGALWREPVAVPAVCCGRRAMRICWQGAERWLVRAEGLAAGAWRYCSGLGRASDQRRDHF